MCELVILKRTITEESCNVELTLFCTLTPHDVIESVATAAAVKLLFASLMLGLRTATNQGLAINLD